MENAQLDTERAVIGCIFRDEMALSRLDGTILAHHFTAKSLKEVYAAFLEMRDSGKLIDPLTFQTHIGAEQFIRLGGSEMVATCMDAVPYDDRLLIYAETLQKSWVKREFEDCLKRAIATNQEYGFSAAADLVSETARSLQSGLGGNGFRHISESLANWFQSFEAGLADPALVEKRYLPTGIAAYDEKFGGLRLGLNILAARPGMGKSAYALNEALAIAKTGKKVLIVSIEMPEEEIDTRLLSMLSGINSTRLDKYQLDSRVGEHEFLMHAYSILAGLEIYLAHVNSLDQIIGEINQWRAKQGCNPDAVFIDYLQLIESSESSNEYQELTQISRRLMKYFKFDAQCPCRLLSQLSRKVEDRNNKRPLQSDIRGSGGIEQDADVIDFLFRPDYYDQSAEEGVTEVIRTKSRQCPTGTVKVIFDKETMSFHPYTGGQYE
jgi:replicative DNA helicase